MLFKSLLLRSLEVTISICALGFLHLLAVRVKNRELELLFCFYVGVFFENIDSFHGLMEKN